MTGRAVLAGKRAIVTGGARGIGLATARRLVREGAAVTIWDIDEDALRAARDVLRREQEDVPVWIASCDITNPAAVKQAVAYGAPHGAAPGYSASVPL